MPRLLCQRVLCDVFRSPKLRVKPGCRSHRWLCTATNMILHTSLVAGLFLGSQAAAHLTANSLHRNAPSLPLGLWRNLQERAASEVIDSQQRCEWATLDQD